LRILVDTSAWVDFFNGSPSPASQAVEDLFSSDHEICTCGVVVTEVFQGFRKGKRQENLSGLFRDLTLLEPAGIDFYFQAADLYRALRQRGKTIRSTIDCMIAVLAEQHTCSVLARDRDMDTILDSGLLTIGRWPMERPS
jgi:predicted nucleic acid-binding protein